ncbi:hypothetical protein QL285_088382 [Trifolium repens]|nr:hypothetical protein QL285_088382 [Trifolium repens]
MKHEETPQSFHLHLRQIQTHSSQAHPNSVPNFTVTSSPSHHLPILSNAISLLTLSPPIILSRQHLFPVSRVSNLVLTVIL